MKRFKSSTNEDLSTPIIKLVPTIFTLLALFLSLSSIRFALHENWTIAVAFIVVASIFDGVDGRIARFLNASSEMGAQLDSLADFVNFGIVPPMILYFWTGVNLSIKGFAWGAVLLFASCMAIRLARFNVKLESEDQNDPTNKYFFQGVPAPVGAGLLLLPMITSFQFGKDYVFTTPLFSTVYMVVIALLLVSTIPTISVKKIGVSRQFINLFLALLSIVVIGLIVEPWFVLTLMGVVYILTMPIVIIAYFRTKMLTKQK